MSRAAGMPAQPTLDTLGNNKLTAFCDYSLDNKQYWTLGYYDFEKIKFLF